MTITPTDKPNYTETATATATNNCQISEAPFPDIREFTFAFTVKRCTVFRLLLRARCSSARPSVRLQFRHSAHRPTDRAYFGPYLQNGGRRRETGDMSGATRFNLGDI